jgi:hypothetical protein
MSRRSDQQKVAARRAQSVKLNKPFPWATVALSTVLVLALAGILGYAVVHQGAGYVDPLEAADERFPQVVKYDDLDRAHVIENVEYEQNPPVGGKHAPVWANCQGAVFTDRCQRRTCCTRWSTAPCG